MNDEEFLARLAKEAREFGWSGDYIEIEAFVSALHEKYNVPCPDLEPIEK